jgi:amino acid transporter
MDWYETPAQPSPPERTLTGVRRGLLTAVLAVGLLGVGGVAAVMAASPDPSASSAPNATTQPSGNGGTTAPSARPGHGSGVNCPNMGGNSGSSSGSSSDSSNGVSGSNA